MPPDAGHERAHHQCPAAPGPHHRRGRGGPAPPQPRRGPLPPEPPGGPAPNPPPSCPLLPLPVLTIGGGGRILHANSAAEAFFDASLRVLQRQSLPDLVPFGSPVLTLVEEVRQRGASVSEHRIDVGGPRIGAERIVDAFAT